MKKLACLACALVACSSTSTSTVNTDSGLPGQDSGTASETGTADAASGLGCPNVNLPTTLPLTYNGDTTGKPNLVSSPRLEWTTAPNDALLFVAPKAGKYRIGMPTAPSTNGGCGASATSFDGKMYTESACPGPGSTETIDGVFAATPPTVTTDLQLTQGQHLLIWVGCTRWSNAQSGPYTLTIQGL